MEAGWSGGTDGWTVSVAIIVGFLLLLGWYSVSAFSQLEKMGIRHPKPLPFIGNILLFQKGVWEGAADIISRYGPITGYYMGRRPIVLLSDPEAIKQVLRTDFTDFPNRMKLNLARKPMSDSLLCLRDGRWRHVRSALTPSFSAGRMKEVSPLIGQACDALLSNLLRYADSGEPCDVQRSYECYTMDLVTSMVFGTLVDSQRNPEHPIVQNNKKFLELFSPCKPLLLLTLAFPSIVLPITRFLPNKNHDQINGFLRKTVSEMIALRDRQPANERRRDILQFTLDARDSAGETSVDHFDIIHHADLEALQKEGEGSRSRETPTTSRKSLSEDEILGQAAIFLIAGYDNTCSLLSFTTYLLATHPECQEKLLKEVDQFAETHEVAEYGAVDGDLPYMDMVIWESLRMFPPAFRFAREAARDCTVMGRKIPAGTVIEIPVSYVQNDPRFWPEPQRFWPERFTAEEKQKRHPFTYLPFGAGPRSCIGIRLALLKAKISLFRILQKVRFETCALTQIPLQHTSASTLRPKDGVYVKVVAR